jgi:hypothetical protein
MIVHDVKKRTFDLKIRRSATKYVKEKFFTIANNQKLKPKNACTQKINISRASISGLALNAFFL